MVGSYGVDVVIFYPYLSRGRGDIAQPESPAQPEGIHQFEELKDVLAEGHSPVCPQVHRQA